MLPVGSKLDAGKDRWDLVDWPWAVETVKVLTKGAVKYSPDNWKIVPGARRRYIAALFRHVVAWARGETNDPEDGLHHLAHASCCLMFLFWFDKNPGKEVPDEEKQVEEPKVSANGVGSNLGLLARAKRRKD